MLFSGILFLAAVSSVNMGVEADIGDTYSLYYRDHNMKDKVTGALTYVITAADLVTTAAVQVNGSIIQFNYTASSTVKPGSLFGQMTCGWDVKVVKNPVGGVAPLPLNSDPEVSIVALSKGYYSPKLPNGNDKVANIYLTPPNGASDGSTQYPKTLALINQLRNCHQQAAPLTLDPTLSAASQSCAAYIRKTLGQNPPPGTNLHVCPETANGASPRYGQNIATTPSRYFTDEAGVFAVQAWYSEVANYTYDDPYSGGKMVGHFTQLVYNSATSVGFGFFETGGFPSFFVADFVPPQMSKYFPDNVKPRDEECMKNINWNGI